jgi:hypothetical protein
VRRLDTKWMMKDFPIHEEVEDHAGRRRAFVIDCHRGELGYTVRATEEGKDGLGYQFGAYSETSPFSALGRVRQKMYRALATRHLSVADGACRMLHDGLEGRITSDANGQVILVVDGVPLGMEEVESLLRSHEGWSFSLQIVDSLE